MENQRNWAGNYTYGAAELLVPESVEEAREQVARSSRIKALGSRHSFNGIADTAGSLISLEKLNRILRLDAERRTVTVEGGIRYGDLARKLHEAGFALHNLASLPHISVAGAVATATHGSGERHGNLATAVRELELIAADGSLQRLSREDAEFEGAVVGLGGLGVIASLTLDIVPAFEMSQRVYEGLPPERLEADFDKIASAAYSVSLFTDWTSSAINQVWVKHRVGDPETRDPAEPFHGAQPAAEPRHPVPGLSGEMCSGQLGAVGPWHERLPHFRMDFTPSAGEELQTEYFVPRERALEALQALGGLRERIAPLLFVSEIRTIAADELWMSPCHGRDSVGIHFTWKPLGEPVARLLPDIEAALRPFGARPHWAKLFAMAPEELRGHYERLADFQQLLQRLDPERKFANALLERYVYG
ncbi:FAD-binding protein [Paenibacillus albicereus]|uniref:FAD-binding protein n=1 Tax=Paenibacillus albicereus TaxID=2726185 RepID=A0A6H2GT65_9BACL|nr:FAD-binding protein [Paenibacillus albicereus]QJC50600.1 FAD-binding protein [Paenibacillus albicereus]